MKSWDQDLFLGLSDSESELLHTMFPDPTQKLVMITQITGPIIWIQTERQSEGHSEKGPVRENKMKEPIRSWEIACF